MIRSRGFSRVADYDAKTLWQHVKGMIRAIQKDDGVLIFDDTIQEKPYTDENDLICWHYDHSQKWSRASICSIVSITQVMSACL